MLRLKLLKRNKNFLKSVAVLIFAIIVITGFYIFIELNGNGEVEEEKIPEKEIDDRISPQSNQAVFLEIHRIRKKGIIEHMETSGSGYNLINNIKNQKLKIYLDGMRPGIGWDEKPSFSYIATLYDYTEEGRQTYKNWDTGYINNIIFRARSVTNIKINYSHIFNITFILSCICFLPLSIPNL